MEDAVLLEHVVDHATKRLVETSAHDTVLHEPVLAAADPRWVGSGRVVLDNKGSPVRQYEPYFLEHREGLAALVKQPWLPTTLHQSRPLWTVRATAPTPRKDDELRE